MRRELLILGCGALLGCADDSRPAEPDESVDEAQADAGEPTVEESPFVRQAALGATLYGQQCASCHGKQGEGSPEGPRLVDLSLGALPLEPRTGASRSVSFVTVADVAQFAVANMPPERAGSLTPEQYWAILAFDLSANGIKLERALTPELATTLTIPR